MVRASTSLKILCVTGLMVCAGGSAAPLIAQRDPGEPRTATAGQLIISEFRLHGPAGVTDEFIEVANTLTVSHTVAAASGGGYGIAASDGVTRCTIPNGTVIPAQGHFLCVNTSGYSLGGYPGGILTASGDAGYTLDIPENAGIALFNNNSGGASYSPANRLDAVGSTSEPNALYLEGTGYQALASPLPNNYAWVRKVRGSCTGSCTPQSPRVYGPQDIDSNVNANDFYYTDTVGAVGVGELHRLGAPAPQNLSGPVAVGDGDVLRSGRASTCSSFDAPPNRLRSLIPGDPTAAPLGTLDLRVNWKNTSGVAITRLRFRVVDVTVFPEPFGTADLRPMSSSSTPFSIDTYPCGSPDGSGTANGTTLEQPPAQSGGGGLNSSLGVTAVSQASPLASGGNVNVRFVLGIVQTGFARFCVVAETTPAVMSEPWCYIGTTDTPAVRPAAGDFDFDHAADMVVYNAATGAWTARQSSEGFAFDRILGGSVGVPVPGDYDGDGITDIASYNEATGQFNINFSRGNYARGVGYGLGGPSFKAVPGDYDGDGITDIAFASATRNLWRVYGSSRDFGLIEERDFAGSGFTPIGGQDFDGDGRTDMVLYNERLGLWAHRVSSSNFDTTIFQSWGGPGFTLVPGDYDGDNRSDYGVYQRATGNWYVLLSGGSAPYTTAFSGSWGGPGYVPVPADYDGDRRIDIAVYQAAATRFLALRSTSSYTTLLQATVGTLTDRPVSTAVLPAGTREIHAGDLDGDATSDLIVYNTTSGIWSGIMSSEGFGSTGSRSHGGTGYTAAPGDYDGDGRGDLGVYQQSTGQWIVLRSMDDYATTYSFNSGGPGWISVPGDYDGDGRTDMIVYNTTTGQWYGRKSSGDFMTTLSVSWGGTGYTAVPGDYDGDGKMDLGVYHEASGYWFVLTSSSNYTASAAKYFGGTGYAPIPADFDGDGLTDVAVYQASTGTWTILRSGAGSTIGFTVLYGGAGYTPVAGDWDGDRRADIAVQTAAGNWSILLSSSNYTTSLNRTLGGAGQVPIPAFP